MSTDQTEKRVLRQEARTIGMCRSCTLKLALPGSARCRRCLIISRVNYFRRNGLRFGERRCAHGCGAVFNRFEMFGGVNRKICSRCLSAMRSAYADPDPVVIDEYLDPDPVVIDEYLQGGSAPLLTMAVPQQSFGLSRVEFRKKEAEKEAEEERRQRERARRQQQEAEWQRQEAEWQRQTAEQRARWEQDRANRKSAQEAEHERLLEERKRLLEERRTAQASARAPLEALFSEEFLSTARQCGSVVDLCGVCSEPYWILYDNLVNWSLHWKGPPRCRTCYCPPLTARVRRENPTWTPLRVSHEVLMAIWGHGLYAQVVELKKTHAWWAAHEHDYQRWIAEEGASGDGERACGTSASSR